MLSCIDAAFGLSFMFAPFAISRLVWLGAVLHYATAPYIYLIRESSSQKRSLLRHEINAGHRDSETRCHS